MQLYPIKMQVNRSTYYHHILRAPEQTKIQLEDDRLKALITEIFTKSECRFGARKIRAKLIQAGYTVSERRILRLMKELGLTVQQKHPKLNFANDRQYWYYPNKLKRKFLTDAPNKISAPGNPHDNAVAESFFAAIKREDFRQKFYKSETEFCHAVDRYVEFYNDYRPHQRLGFLTPNQAEEKFY